MRFEAEHDEVVGALRAIGSARWGAAIAADRGSSLDHMGIGFPDLRRRVKQGFSFYGRPEDEVLAVWDDLWKESPYGDVLFAACEYYAPRLRRGVDPRVWPAVRSWTGRVDNWCHADALGGLYARILDALPAEVWPVLTAWNLAESQWLRRISLTSLIHYSGKNAVFLSPAQVLPMVTNCLDDRRHYVQTAVGWVLREMGNVYTDDVTSYLRVNIGRFGAEALTRAIERRAPAERAELRALRKPSR